MCECQRRQAHKKSHRESQHHGEKTHTEEKLEDKRGRGDGSDDDGGAVPIVYAALDPDDAEPDPAADPAAARSCCHYER